MARGMSVKELRPDPIYFEAGGKRRTVKFDLNSFAELEKKYGSVEAAMKELQTGNMKAVRTILWAGLIHEEAILDEEGEPIGYNITPYQVGGWVLPRQMEKISKMIESAIAIALPPPDEEKVSVQEQQAPLTTADGHVIATVEAPSGDAKN